MLFNIVGHKIDGNYESWNCLLQKLRGDRHAPSRDPYSPHPGQGGFKGDVKIMHIKLLFSDFIRSYKVANTLINNIFFCNVVLLVFGYLESVISKMVVSLRRTALSQVTR